MSDSGAGVGKETVGGGALSKPCQWTHVRARRRFAAMRRRNHPEVEQQRGRVQRCGGVGETLDRWSPRLRPVR